MTAEPTAARGRLVALGSVLFAIGIPPFIVSVYSNDAAILAEGGAGRCEKSGDV